MYIFKTCWAASFPAVGRIALSAGKSEESFVQTSMSSTETAMSVVAPMPVNPNHHGSPQTHFSRLNQGNFGRRGSSDLGCPHSNSNPAISREPDRQLTSLEDLAARIEEQTLLEDTGSGAFSYLDNKLYGEDCDSIPFLPKKSRSLPSSYYSRKSDKSATSSKTTLRKVKSVKFADTYGLPLVEAVHQLTNLDSSYTENKIVPYADEDLLSKSPLILGVIQRKCNTSNSESSSKNCSPVKFVLNQGPLLPSSTSYAAHKHIFTFTLPSLEPDFLDRVKRENVVLESAREEPRILHGIVRVSNLAYAKEVLVRWTHDNWRTSHDTSSVFCSNDGDTDRFAFELPINGDDVVFAIRYHASGKDYWDNNHGINYTVLSRPHS